MRKTHRYLTMEEIVTVVKGETGVKDILQSTGTTRQIIMIALYKHADLNNREIGDLQGVDYSTVSQGRKRLRKKVETDSKIQSVLIGIDNELSKIKI